MPALTPAEIGRCRQGLDERLTPGIEAVLRAELQEPRLGRRLLLSEADLVPVSTHDEREMRPHAGARDHLAVGDLEEGDLFHTEFDAALPRRAPEDLADFQVGSTETDIESAEVVQLDPGRDRNPNGEEGEPADDGDGEREGGEQERFASEFHGGLLSEGCGLGKNY